MQPILIGRGFIQTHKFIGKLSYGLAPLVVVSILFVAREKYFRLEHEVSASQNLGELTVNVCSMFYFSLLYVLAIYFRKNTAIHMRFMISSALLVLDPGLGRIFTNHIGTSFDDSVVYSVIITEILTVILLVNDLRKGLPYIPYTLSLFFLASFQILWAFRYSDIWQAFLSGFVKLVF
ncbi:MAG TPA: hypothetical protein PLQ93_08150 [Bacteroidia bacterium]|nr:hypothetical protein [Bacteroidia bacterium]